MTEYVFISYASADQETANRLVAQIEKRAIPCWIASRNIRPGQDYQNAIVHALEGAGVVLCLFSRAANESADIPKELALASKFKKNIIPARINDIVPTGSFAYQMTTAQFIDLFDDFEAKVDELCSYLAETLQLADVVHQRIHGEQRQRVTKRKFSRAGIGVLVVLMVAGIGFAMAPRFAAWLDVLVRSRSTAPAPPPAPSAAKHTISSLAVLPLDNLSGDPSQEFFADGMTEELTTDLAKISALRVISRSSVMQFKGEHRKPVPEMAKALNVDAVVEGSVLRVGEKVRITAQLIDASIDKHLWAESYERDSRDVLALQDEVASAIARQINIEVTPQERANLSNARQVNPKAHEAYLKGRYYVDQWTGESQLKAYKFFGEAIGADPGFAPAYAGLADLYSGSALFLLPPGEVMPQAKEAAQKAVELDDTLAEGHTSLALSKLQYDLDWTGSESEYRRAIALNPSYAEAHVAYAIMLAMQARFDEALEQAQRGNELDPLNLISTLVVAFVQTLKGNYEASREQLHKVLGVDPNQDLVRITLDFNDVEAGELKETISDLSRPTKIEYAPFVKSLLGYVYASSGEPAKAQKLLDDLKQLSGQEYVSPFWPTLIYLGLGDKDRALDGLEKTYQAHSPLILAIKAVRLFDPLRTEPRFIALLKKTHLDK